MSAFRSVVRRCIDRVGRTAGDQGETVVMYQSLGYLPNLLWPRSFNEKVVRRKLGRTPEQWSTFADKVEVRQLVAERVGSEHLTDVFLVTDTPADIRCCALPRRFVVKATHGSGWTRVVRDASVVDEEGLQQQCQDWLRRRYGVATHEAWYGHIRPRLLVEEFLEDHVHGVPLDYKSWVFHGRVEFVQIDFSRFEHHTRTMYDRHWVRQPWVTQFPPGPSMPRPPLLDALIEVAESLAVNPEFVRVDLYCPNDERVVFGELTFAPGAGWEPFNPDPKYDFEVGARW